MNSPTYFYARLNGLLVKSLCDVCFFGKLFSRSRVAFANQVVIDDGVDIPVQATLALMRHVQASRVARDANAAKGSEIQVNVFSTCWFGEIPNLF